MSVLEKLMKARVMLQAIPLKKSGENKFAGFKYFELGDFLPQTQTIFSDLGLCGVTSFDKDFAKLTITDIEDGSNIEILSPSAEVTLKGCMAIQGIGAAQTYLRRYLWVAAMEIVEHDVLDATTGKDEPKAKGSAKGSITPTSGAVAALSKSDQDTARIAASNIEMAWKDGEKEKAWKYFYGSNLENDLMVAIWDLLKPMSAMRNELKKIDEQKRGV